MSISKLGSAPLPTTPLENNASGPLAAASRLQNAAEVSPAKVLQEASLTDLAKAANQSLQQHGVAPLSPPEVSNMQFRQSQVDQIEQAQRLFQDACHLVSGWGEPPRTPSAQDRAKGMAEMAEASALLGKVAGGLPPDLRAEVRGLETSWQENFSSLFQGKTEIAPDQKLGTVGLDTLEQKILNLPPPGDPATDIKRLGRLR